MTGRILLILIYTYILFAIIFGLDGSFLLLDPPDEAVDALVLGHHLGVQEGQQEDVPQILLLLPPDHAAPAAQY